MALELNGTTGVSLVQDGVVTAADLSSTLDLSEKTVTLPAGTGGKVLQVVTATISETASSASIPFDNTVPQISEGFQIVSASITPSSTSSKIMITATFVMDKYQAGSGTAALFNGSSNAIYAVTKTTAEDNNPTPITMTYLDSPSTTSAVTYSIRCGGSGGSTMWINNTSGGPRMGGSLDGQIILMEIAG